MVSMAILGVVPWHDRLDRSERRIADSLIENSPLSWSNYSV